MHVIWHQNEVSGHSSAGQQQPRSAPAFGLLSASEHATVRPVRTLGGFKSRLLPPSRSAPIGVNCIPFEMGEVCLALQRDLQPPTHPTSRPSPFFVAFCGSPEPNSCRFGRRGGLFFRLPPSDGLSGGIDRFCFAKLRVGRWKSSSALMFG